MDLKIGYESETLALSKNYCFQPAVFQSKGIISKQAFSSLFRGWYKAKAILSKKKTSQNSISFN